MICYQGRTFCLDKECGRFDACPDAYTAEHEAKALRWWGKEGAPVAFYGERMGCFVNSEEGKK